ncbi:MAG: M6 family metalloprotease domain-containing protein [Salinivirgaceae bacterium]|jgi:M6 family metalloprotease-like protein
MQRLIKLLLLTFVGVSTLSTLKAVPAYPGIIQQTQSDGTTLNYYLYGDEYFSWARTTDDYTIKRNAIGDYVYMVKDSYGDLVLSEVIAHNPELRSQAEQLFLSTLETKMFYSESQMSIVQQAIAIRKAEEEKSSRAFPTTGDRKLICILIGYTDRPFVKTQAEFNALFNEVGYTTGGATGSVKDYYLENSYNKFNLTVDVAGPYTASQNMAYYGAPSGSSHDVNPRALVSEAINLADPHVNFAEYDNDNDGWVDGVYIIFAGYGQEAGGGDNTIWSHAWSLASPVMKDGVYIQRYSCSPELRGNFGQNITYIGVICHEFGHVLGALDYYDTNYATGGQYSGTGKWDMMASGSWNNGGATPAHHNGYTKTKVYNWASVNVLNQNASVTIRHAAFNQSSFYQINTTTNGEYFFIENRHQQGFDAYVPGNGMIIYHVHAGINQVGNQINATHPQRMYPVCASATMDPTSDPSSYGNINSQGCAWPYNNKTSFTDWTLPSSKSWAGNNTEKPITNIEINTAAKTVSFDFMGGGTLYTTTFNVVDGENNPVEDATIVVNQQTSVTNVVGVATFQLLNGAHTYSISKDGYVDAAGKVFVDGENATFTVTLHDQIIPPFNVMATLVGVNSVKLTWNNTPKSFGDIYNNNLEDGILDEVSKADNPKGFIGYDVYINSWKMAENLTTTECVLADLPVGVYAIGVQSVYSSGSSEIVYADSVTVLSGFYVTFIVKSGAQPLEGALVTINNYEVTTYANGEAMIKLANGEYNYTVSKSGYSTLEGSLVVSGADQTIPLNMIGICGSVDNLVRIYPNPVKSTLTIERKNDDKAAIELYNISGMLVGTTKTENTTTTIDVETLDSGAYFIRIIETNNTTVYRFIKQ